MKTALLVIDMQRILVGKNHAKLFKYDNAELLRQVNRHISEYPAADVYYIRNQLKKNLINRLCPVPAFDDNPDTELADELTVVSENIFRKYTGDSFTNPDLLASLQAQDVTQVDIIGVDGAGCVPKTAEGAIKSGLTVRILSDAVATMSPSRAARQKARVTKLGVQYVD